MFSSVDIYSDRQKFYAFLQLVILVVGGAKGYKKCSWENRTNAGERQCVDVRHYYLSPNLELFYVKSFHLHLH